MIDYKEHLRKAERDLRMLGMESVRLLAELYERGEFTPENQQMVYERERYTAQQLRDDIAYCKMMISTQK